MARKGLYRCHGSFPVLVGRLGPPESAAVFVFPASRPVVGCSPPLSVAYRIFCGRDNIQISIVWYTDNVALSPPRALETGYSCFGKALWRNNRSHTCMLCTSVFDLVWMGLNSCLAHCYGDGNTITAHIAMEMKTQ